MIESHYPTFTAIYRAYRPHEPDHVVYGVDSGDVEHYSLAFIAGKIENDKVVGESVVMILSKEWLIENHEKFAQKDLDIPQ
jgi:hypothetical protein